MTLILAANLSDRILLASDTKVTRLKNDQRETVGYSIKLVQYNDQPISEDNKPKHSKDLGNFISCMYAGNKDFAFFIHQKLSLAFEKRELTTDINKLQNQIHDFFKKIVPEYEGVKRCLMIFAGVSTSGAIKMMSFNRLSELLGPAAGSLDDPHVVGALEILSRWAPKDGDIVPFRHRETGLFLPDQKIFSFEIDETKSIFGISKVGGSYSIIAGGSTFFDDVLESKVLKYFLSKRDFIKEGLDVINYIRNNFSDTIGGAVTLGYIDLRGRLIHSQYNIDRSGKLSDKNWSLELDGGGIMAVDPAGKKIDLVQGFFNGLGNSDWCL